MLQYCNVVLKENNNEICEFGFKLNLQKQDANKKVYLLP